jgi:creatinine amidohydrolase
LGEYVKAIILSAASHGVKKVVIVNSHGGNEPIVLEVADELRRRHNVFAVHLMAFPPDLLNSPIHGDVAETSVNLYLHKSLAKMGQARTTKVKHILAPSNQKAAGSWA